MGPSTEAEAIPITPEARAIGHPEGTPVVLTDGREWLLAHDPPRLGGVWDVLFDDNVIRGKYDPADLYTAGHRLLQANYRLSHAEALELIQVGDRRSLVGAVERALFGPDARHGTYSEWVEASLWAIGVNPDDVPPRLRRQVMEIMETTKRTVPSHEFISSQQAMVARGRMMQSSRQV